MNNHHTSTHSPTARCKTYARLLPILDEPDIEPEAMAEARAHFSSCAYCQEQHAAYRQLEVAARRYFSPPATPRYQTEEIMRDLLGTPAASFEIETETPKLIPAHISTRKPYSPRPFVSSLASLAAVLVIVVVSVTLFASRMHTQGGTKNGAATPGTLHSSFSSLADISMVSPTGGWAVGPEINTLLHYNGQRWVTVPLAADKNATFQISRLRMVSATDGWAVGMVETMIPQPGSTLSLLISRTPLILHYQHGTWSVLPTS